MRSMLLFAVAGLAASGCTHAQLRRSTVGQASILSDVYQQQVLDNLAKFVADPNALPHFAVPSEGFTEVTDSGGADGSLEWNGTQFAKGVFAGDAGRQVEENYALKPVTDPRKLELIRCAFQRAVSGCTCLPCSGCPDCDKRLRRFYTGKTDGSISKKTRTGITTSECLDPSCWFCYGCSDCGSKIRRKNPCCKVGEHCGVAVWVNPGHGSDELAKLTLTVLDYAINDPPVVATKTREIVAYLADDGSLSKESEATFIVRGEVAVDKPVTDILYGIPRAPTKSETADLTNAEAIPFLPTLSPKAVIEPPPIEDSREIVVPSRRSPDMMPLFIPRQQIQRNL